mmetsp:Transcript_23601/g.76284  ORF Transcript_23601/g.76284 Transcript_23601/m.76284 type:complete len:548 (+) Transcript_23601:80-1723(+)
MLPRSARRLATLALLVLLVHFLCEVSEELCALRIITDWFALTVPSCPIEAHGRTVSSEGDERYLVYQPQFGLSNQLIALRNAAAWAVVLNRTLVVPHILGHLDEAEYTNNHRPHRTMTEFANAFDYASAARTLAPLKVMDMDSFLVLRLPVARLVQVDTVKMSLVTVHDDYFQALAARGFPVVSTAAPVGLQLRKGLPKTILRVAGGCHAQRQVLAMRSLFGMWDVQPGFELPGWTVPGRADISGSQWLDRVVMPALLRPAPPMRAVVDRIVQSILASAATDGTGGAGPRAHPLMASPRRGALLGARRLRDGQGAAGAKNVGLTGHFSGSSGSLIGEVAGGGVGGAPDDASPVTELDQNGRVRSAPAVMACVHVRRGDFEKDCPKYEAESRARSGRGWVKSHIRHGCSCIQEPIDLELNLRALARRHAAVGGPPGRLAIFASVEDPAWISDPQLGHWNMSHLGQHAAHAGAAQLQLPWELAAPLLDQLVCSRARYFVLNIFSTFSQAVMAHLGLANGASVGWVRHLTEQQQRQLGVEVAFWRNASWL